MMKTRLLVSLFLIFVLAGLVKAQNGSGDKFNWGNEPQRAKEQYTLLGDDITAKSFSAARVPLNWLLKNTPDLNKSLYMRGAEVYEGLVGTEKDEKLKKNYQDSALVMYDLRVKYFQDEANVINRKGYRALTYWQTRPEKFGDLYDLYSKIVEMNGNATFSQNISSYMYLVAIMKKNNQKGLTDEKVLDIYDKLSTIVKTNSAKDAAAWGKVQEYLDQQLESCVKIDCEFVKNQFGPKIKANPKDTDLAAKIYALMIQGSCINEPLFLDAAFILVEKEPTFQRYKTIAFVYKQKDDEANFIKYMNKAFEYGGTNSEKADLYLNIAQEDAKKGDKSSARANALKAASFDGSKTSAAYSFIGYLYLNSGRECVTSDKDTAPVYNTVAYLAAYEMFQKAGDATGMAKASQYFPTAENIFTIGMTEKIGTQVPVGCWIGGTATLRKR